MMGYIFKAPRAFNKINSELLILQLMLYWKDIIPQVTLKITQNITIKKSTKLISP